ncbi:hypothetical protein H6G89_32850 [Oscillatoria sp. FACHB-1407]|uniref:hypothetical protein n=1 Tax=Oscillatoria sp. FACHB-1407 TaxID=2692847 RepID=UPI00168720CE|nr:hypothetical protein [Oscillatoria sp. FACHB-1407]MBD2465780.1 hypothetical protein [Oscillatoria sp. FACHB-1407]
MNLSPSLLILPGDPEFDLTLSCSLPPGWVEVARHMSQQIAFVASADSGLLRPATNAELTEYLYGGEYGERLNELELGHDLGKDL